MQALSQVVLRSGSTALSTRSEKRLSDEQVLHLLTLLEQTAARYPHQDLAPAMEGYLHDFEALALKYGMEPVHQALMELRIKPRQRFFPQPSEVAEVIEEIMAKQAVEERQSNPIRDCAACGNSRLTFHRTGEGGALRTWAEDCECLKEWRLAKQLRSTEPSQDLKSKGAGQ